MTPDAADRPAMIRLEGVSKRFHGPPPVHAVRQVSLTVAAGELAVIVGESGSGKTTTLKMINRLVECSDGRIEVDGASVADRDPIPLRRRIGYVFQDIGLFPHWSVAQNVGVTLRLLGWDRGRIDARVREVLGLVGLDPDVYAARSPASLSGGQAQRVGVARGLAAAPSVLLMDEPFGALDPVTRSEVQTELRALQRRLELTVVLVTHDMSEALLLADRIFVMKDGEVVGHGTPAALLRDPAHPYIATLLETPRRHAAHLAALMKSGGDS